MTTIHPPTEAPEFSVRNVAWGQAPGFDALVQRMGTRSSCPGETGAVSPANAAWAQALERDGEVLAAAWCAATAQGPARFIVAGGLRDAGEDGLAALLRAAFASAQHCAQRRLVMCIPGEQAFLLPLLQRSGFHLHSSVAFGGVAEVELDVAPATWGNV